MSSYLAVAALYRAECLLHVWALQAGRCVCVYESSCPDKVHSSSGGWEDRQSHVCPKTCVTKAWLVSCSQPRQSWL
ncbi:hypothetical protein J3F83DRAFT_448818 [Trichoderma novae-zelandiae]